MRFAAISRVVFGATSAVVTFGLVLQLALSITAKSGAGAFESTPDRIVNFFSFFTVLSNIAVAVTTGLLAVRWSGARRCSGSSAWTAWWPSP